MRIHDSQMPPGRAAVVAGRQRQYIMKGAAKPGLDWLVCTPKSSVAFKKKGMGSNLTTTGPEQVARLTLIWNAYSST